MQHEILSGENGRRKAELDASRQAESQMEMKLEHIKSQLKLSEAIAAEHVELVTKYHENSSRLRVAESELQANLAREATMTEQV